MVADDTRNSNQPINNGKTLKIFIFFLNSARDLTTAKDDVLKCSKQRASTIWNNDRSLQYHKREDKVQVILCKAFREKYKRNK